MIIGIDEVGRGSWAGPVCVAAVALGDKCIPGLTDSKKLSVEQRGQLALQIKQMASFIGVGWADAQVVDAEGLTAALRLAARQAVAAACKADTLLLDGHFDYIGDSRVTTIVKGDDSEPAISAASIVAKVARDNYMKAMAVKHTGYGFERHVGYGTVLHRAALATHGPTVIHRMSFAPLRAMTETA